MYDSLSVANFLCRAERPAYHRKYRARAEEVTQSNEERSLYEIMVVLLSESFDGTIRLMATN
jgi:hypothetical protein